MRLLSKFETVEDVQAREARQHAEAVREARIEAARKQRGWIEIAPAERLISRGPAKYAWVVDSESDFLYRVAPGVWFEPCRATILADRAEGVSFFVDAGGNVVILERVSSIPTWSDVVRKHPHLVPSAAAAK